ncbi:MAG: VWA domain-containing protein [Bacteriovorax sp.]|jgi:Ca-activated chloride channel family protein|nr:VWA domain-containing protein [Bacteriovorax sp.]
MSFANTQYFLAAIGIIFIISIMLNRLNNHFFKWVKMYWFFERTWASRVSSLFYLLSLFLFMVSLLDLRGPEKKVKANLPDQKTIIILDASSSMLSEDVRPSRFAKSIQLARHFVKSAAGHQVSIVLFSDVQKRLLPFTDDIDLIDSRLAALEKMNSVAGGSNISQAIAESIEYFDSLEDEKSKSGNILVFTDAEESEGEFKVDIPKNVNLAIVGVGTLKGGNIPLRYEDGGFKGYKTFKGEQVVTKLDEEYLRKIGKGVKNYKYWIVNSYSLPTEELKNFFRDGYTKKLGMGDLRIRPVYSHYILIPAIILYCLSVVFGRFAMFKMVSWALVLISVSFGLGDLRAEDKQTSKEHAISPGLKKDLEIVKSGKGSREFTLKVAEKLLKENQEQKATSLYSEYAKKNDTEEVRFNQVTALLKSNRVSEALPLIQDLLKDSKNDDLKNKLRNNILIAMDPSRRKEQEQNQKQKQDDKKENKEEGNQESKEEGKQENKQDKQKQGNQNQKENKDNKEQSQKNKSGEKQDGKGDSPGDKIEKEEKEKNNEKKEGEDKDKGKEKQEGNDKKEDEKTGPKSLEEKEKEIEQKRKMVKTPAMIKQIMSDDRELQKKLMDTSTNQRGEQRPKRDW